MFEFQHLQCNFFYLDRNKLDLTLFKKKQEISVETKAASWLFLLSALGSAFLLPAVFGSWVTQLRVMQTKQLAVQRSPHLTPSYEAELSGGSPNPKSSGESQILQITSMWH